MTRQSLGQYELAGHLIETVARHFPDLTRHEHLLIAHQDALNATARGEADGRADVAEMWADVATELQIQINNSIDTQADTMMRFVKTGLPLNNISEQIEHAIWLSQDRIESCESRDQPDMGEWWRKVITELTARLETHHEVMPV